MNIVLWKYYTVCSLKPNDIWQNTEQEMVRAMSAMMPREQKKPKADAIKLAKETELIKIGMKRKLLRKEIIKKVSKSLTRTKKSKFNKTQRKRNDILDRSDKHIWLEWRERVDIISLQASINYGRQCLPLFKRKKPCAEEV